MLGLGVGYAAHSRSHRRIQIGLRVSAVDAHRDLGSALLAYLNGLLQRDAGVVLLSLRHRVLEVVVEAVTVAQPGALHEALGVYRHHQPRASDSSRHRGPSCGDQVFRLSRDSHASAQASVSSATSRESAAASGSDATALACATSSAVGVKPSFRARAWSALIHSAPRKPARRPSTAARKRVRRTRGQAARGGAPPGAQWPDPTGVRDDYQPLVQVWQQVQVSRRLFPQVHREVSAPQAHRLHPVAGGYQILGVPVAATGVQAQVNLQRLLGAPWGRRLPGCRP